VERLHEASALSEICRLPPQLSLQLDHPRVGRVALRGAFVWRWTLPDFHLEAELLVLRLLQPIAQRNNFRLHRLQVRSVATKSLNRLLKVIELALLPGNRVLEIIQTRPKFIVLLAN
jgi:hypothetical protein